MKNMKTNFSRQKLGAYSAFAVAFLSMQDEVAGQILYTDVSPDFLFTDGSVSPPEFDYVNVDFDLDGNNEILIGFGSLTSAGTCYRLGYRSFYVANYVSVLASATSGGYENLKVLDEGDVISAAGNWVASTELFFRSFVRSEFYMDSCDADIEYAEINGVWNDKAQKYLGIRFIKDDSAYYGYIRVTARMLPDSGDAIIDTLQVDGYAFEQSGNTAIVAGAGYVPSGITEQEIIFGIYPNPATDILTIRTENAIADKLRYIITDMQGRNITEGDIYAHNSNIPVSDLAAGMYLIELFTDTHQRAGVQQFVKQ